MQRIITLLTISFVFILSSLRGQDARFSQFYANPLQLNPALIGVFEGKMRFSANYKQQYSSILKTQAYTSFSAGLEFRNNVNRGDFAAFSLAAFRDQAGISKFTRTRVLLGGAFMKQLGGSRKYKNNSQYLVAGAQIGLGQHSFDWSGLWFSQQFDNSNPSLPFINFDSDPGEIFGEQNSDMYADFNAGLLWYALFDDNLSIYMGGAIHHLTAPNVAFLDRGLEKLDSRYTVHMGGEVPFTEQLSLLPAIVGMVQGPSMSSTVGGNFRYTNGERNELAIRAGLWGHFSNKLESQIGMESVIITAILELETLNIGLSYDITTSELTEANNARGGLEVSLIYVTTAKRKQQLACPNF
ncbi:MAG: PorP/SprF family type IX secretion system membrane protein [Saprospiraceae bacterium]